MGTDLLTLPNVLDLNGNRPSDHTTILGRALSESYLTVTNAQYGAANNSPTCTILGVIGVCVPGVSTYSWSTLPAQDFQVIIGDGAAANGSNTVVMGTNATHRLPATAWTGAGAPDGNYAARLGNAVVVGHGANGTADRQVILGANASSTHANSVALGAGAVTDRGALTNYTATGTSLVRSSVGSVSIGAGATSRQLTHVAAGTQATDAVNVEQMQGAISQVNAVNALAVGYDTAARTGITLQGAGGTTISNLAPGAVTPVSTQAINGAQLHGVSTSVAAGLGGGATVTANGAITAPSYALQGGTVTANSVGAAVADIDGRTTGNTTSINNLLNGTAGLVRQDPGSLAVSVAGTTGGTAVSFANVSGATRSLDGVSAGALSAAGTQAVNTGQLFNTGSTLATRLGGGATLTADGTVTAPAYSLESGTVTASDVGTALGNLDGRATTNTTNINAVLAGTAGLVRQVAPGAALTVGAQTDGTAVGFANNAGAARTLTGVAGGAVTAGSTEALNGGQLFASNAAVASHLGGGAAVGGNGLITAPSYTIGSTAYATVGDAFDAVDGALADATAVGLFAVRYDTDGAGDPDLTRITLGNGVTGGTTLANVAAGIAPTDAVNVSQLAPAVTALGGGAGIDPVTGAVTGPTYTLADGAGGTASFDNVGGALGNLDGRVQGNTTNINNLLGGTAGLVQQAGVAAPLTVGAQTGGTLVDFRALGGAARTLDGVAPAALGSASLQAVNGGQLFGLGTNIASRLGGGATFSAAGVLSAPSYTIRGVTFSNVGSAFTAVDNALADLGGGIGDPGVFAVTYNASVDDPDTPDFSRIALRGTDGTVIGNVAAGANALEAVNVGQLTSALDALGGGAGVDAATGAVIAPTYALDDGADTGTTSEFDNVGDALGNLDGRTVGNTSNINNLLAGTAGLVQQADPTAALTVGAATGGTQVDFTGTGGVARRLSGVANATVATDAANLGQVQAVGASVAAQLGGGAAANPDGTLTAPSYTIAGASYTNVGAAFDAVDAAFDDVVSVGAFAVRYDDDGTGNPNLARITLGAAGTPTRIGNLAAGIEPGDAVNLGQLTPVVEALGGDATVDPVTGAVTGPTYTLDSGANTGTTISYGDVGAALGNLDARVITNTALIEEIDGSGAPRFFRVNSAGAVAQALGADTVAIGPNAIANGAGGVSIGLNAVTGDAADATRVNQVAIGNNARSTAQNSTAVGGDALASGPQSTAFGSAAQATGSNSLAMGRNATAGDSGTAVGMNAIATGVRATALGQGAQATVADSTAVGQFAAATAANSVALGLGSLADRANAVSVGTAAAQRQIINVGDGTQDTDAVNLRQLTAVENQITDLGELAVQYDDASQSRLTLAGADGTTVGNVAAGVADDEAVNVGQLTPVVDALGGGAGIDPVTGAVTGPTYTLDDGSDTATTQDFNDVGSALGNLDTRTTTNTSNVNALLDGSAGLVRQDPATDVVTIAGQTGGSQVSFANASGGARRLSGVAAATDAADAVNLAQLQGASGSVATHLGGGATVNPDGTVTAPTYSIGGASYGNVGAAFDAVDEALGDAVAIGAFAVRYDDDGAGAPNLARITLAGPTGTTLANVEAGVAADEAVNVAQLTPVVDALGGGAGIDPTTGAVTGPTYVLDDGSNTGTTVSVDNVGSAITNLDGRTTTNTSDIAGLLAGTAGLVQQDAATLAIGVGNQVGGTQVDFANNAGDARRLSGVAAGTVDTDAVNLAQLRDAIVDVNSDSVFAVRYDEDVNGDPDYSRITLGGGADGTTLTNVAGGAISAASTEAINGGQLFATHSAIAGLLGGGASVTPLGTLVAPNYAIQGAFYDNVGSALAALNSGLDAVNGRIDGLPPAPSPGGTDALVGVDGPRDGTGDAAVNDGSRGGAVGAAAVSDGDQAVAVGGDSAAVGDNATAIGGSATVQAANGTAVGANATIAATAPNAVAVGEGATVAASGGVAVGQGAQANAGNSVALGQGSVADRANTVSVGSVGGERQLTNVAAGTAGTDAVNVNQMNAGIERALQSANDYTDARLNQMQSDVWEIDRGYRAGVASAMAVAGLPQAYQPGRSMVAAAVSGYEQEAGLAVGITTISESGRWVYKFSGTTNTRNDVGVTVGAGMQW